jgi:uncharacterized membrane protein YeiH
MLLGHDRSIPVAERRYQEAAVPQLADERFAQKVSRSDVHREQARAARLREPSSSKGCAVTSVVASIYDLLDVPSIFVFAVLGGLVAVRRQLPMVLVVVSTVLTGLGGGLVRDLIIGAPPVAIHRLDYLAAVVAAAVLVVLGHSQMERHRRALEIFEALGLALFCVAGTAKVVSHGQGPAVAVALGVFSAVGGGMMRDALVGRFPEFLRREQLLLAAPVVVLSVVSAALLTLNAFDVVSRGAVVLIAIGALLLAMQHYRNAPRMRLAS